jgi:hypothetical protein
MMMNSIIHQIIKVTQKKDNDKRELNYVINRLENNVNISLKKINFINV